MIRILTKNGVDNTNIDGARLVHLTVGQDSGVIADAFNSDSLLILTDNAVTLNTCELIISGHRVVVDSPEIIYVNNTPINIQRLSLIAQISVGIDSTPTFSLFLKQVSESFVQDNLFKDSLGLGTYQMELGRMSQGTNGKLFDLEITVNRLESIQSEVTGLKKYSNNTFANALKGEASGSIVSMKDISPIEHDLSVKASSKNLIPFPYLYGSTTMNGVTFTVNGDGSITANGTAVGNAFVYLFDGLWLDAGQYTLSGCPNGGGFSSYLLAFNYTKDGVTVGGVRDLGESAVQDFAEPITGQLYILIMDGVTVNNLTFKPQFERGAKASSFSTYVDVSTVKVSRIGKNLIPYPYVNKTTTIGGVTYTDNGDGTITANGTATATSIYGLQWYTIPLTKGTYTISGIPANGSASTFMMQVADREGFAKNHISVSGDTFTLDHDSGGLVVQIVVFAGYTASNLVFKPQIEVGSTATGYEPYVQPTEYAPSTEGVIKGVTSIHPVTTLMTDNFGAVIIAEYNKDLNKAFTELCNAIIALGGNI